MSGKRSSVPRPSRRNKNQDLENASDAPAAGVELQAHFLCGTIGQRDHDVENGNDGDTMHSAESVFPAGVGSEKTCLTHKALTLVHVLCHPPQFIRFPSLRRFYEIFILGFTYRCKSTPDETTESDTPSKSNICTHLTLRHLFWMFVYMLYNGFFLAQGDAWGKPTMVTPATVRPPREVIFWHDFWVECWGTALIWATDYFIMVGLVWHNAPALFTPKSDSSTSTSTELSLRQVRTTSGAPSPKPHHSSLARSDLIGRLSMAAPALRFLLVFFVSYLVFDFFSAFWHCMLDNNWGTVLNGGRRTYTEDHHADPQIFNAFSNYELLAYTNPPLWVLLGLFELSNPLGSMVGGVGAVWKRCMRSSSETDDKKGVISRSSPGGTSLLPLFFLFVILQCNVSTLTHHFAHRRNHDYYVPWYFKLMQDLGVVLPGKYHSVGHHNSVVCWDGKWSVYAGWMDPLYDFLYMDVLGGHSPEVIYGLCVKRLSS